MLIIGSKTSTIINFLKAVSPKIAVIGVGKNNKFGHPSIETLENLKKVGCKIYRTDESGEISINVDRKEKIYIKKYRTGISVL